MELYDALNVMQSTFFETWLGTWPESIDWTGAVLGTHVSATLNSFTRANYSIYDVPYSIRDENDISGYFSHLISYYYGEDAFGLRAEAFDDMLWVVLGWLESIKFIDTHSDIHFPSLSDPENGNSTWYGKRFIPTFAHRARVFWELASTGWDESLCGGGMVWSPYLAPYKNAITNELFIAASVKMYLYFPGDSNDFPFSHPSTNKHPRSTSSTNAPTQDPSYKPHDKKYLDAAIRAYDWLLTSNMTNSAGLFIDGFHVSPKTGTCSVRNKMVYTYNQGVILTGQRYLFDATGNRTYLESGHTLLRAVMHATGWPPIKTTNSTLPPGFWDWHGLGRAGILEEFCDSRGGCDQNGQTFKGIFFHHLTTFCAPLRRHDSGDGLFKGADTETALLHQESCREYGPWVGRNLGAAIRTRDERGVFGGWWTPGLPEPVETGGVDEWFERWMAQGEEEEEGVDYRNRGVPDNEVWRGKREGAHGKGWKMKGAESIPQYNEKGEVRSNVGWPNDPNDKGRGRTVETQSGGVAVLRALREFNPLLSWCDEEKEECK
ncbi:hypothetical protein MMC10_003445 [Thelotrema lepadinum]|nr:hypothetical protein [Thelotrema lepadinum]